MGFGARLSRVVAAGLVVTQPAWGQPDRVVYELRERCGKRAAEVFKQEYGPATNVENGQMLSNYENHYSSKLNKCFFLEVSDSYIRNKGIFTHSRSMRLFDLNDNKEYGTFFELFDTGVMACKSRIRVATLRKNGGHS